MPFDLPVMIMTLLGGLALFLYGMEQMSGALKAIAGDGLRKLLGSLTKNRFYGVLTGAFATAVVQSSSVTTVLAVGFISAGLLSLTQSVGIIMGANVGTTITAQIVAFKITEYALGLVAAGFATLFISKKEKLRQAGIAIMGLGLIFFGMGLMSQATNPLRDYQPFIDMMARMDNPFLGILVAAAFTALIQSSSATTGIVIVLALEGFISLEAGIALAFGANLGTCVTAALATLGKPSEAKRAAVVHIAFNLIGVVLWIGFIDHLADWVRAISPNHSDLDGKERLVREVPRQIANAHTLFNVANTFIFIWFTPLFVKLSRLIIRDKPKSLPAEAQPRFLDPIFQETPAIAVDRVRMEVGHLGELVLSMLQNSKSENINLKQVSASRLVKSAHDAELLSAEILSYSRKISYASLSEESHHELEHLLDVTNQLRGVSDTIANNLGTLVKEWRAAQLDASDDTRSRIQSIHLQVTRALRDALTAVQERDYDAANRVIRIKHALHTEIDELGTYLGSRLRSHDPNRVEVYRLESRVLEIERRIYYFAKRIAKTVVAEKESPQKGSIADPDDGIPLS
ncbi:MAG: Na/Pi cotransporter family protein [Akkermansiaceae bacterium]|jgi:phosphate:Na+ symporter|nr:Na/Pi cotransporter family protein [Akkermansiaceae bacterium]